MVEILSETAAQIDRTTKLKLYARCGVGEYWVVDPVGCSAEVYRQRASGFEFAAQPDSAQTLTTPLLPGFTLPLSKIGE